MTTPAPVGSSGSATNAAKRFPSSACSSRSSCETAAPRMTAIGGDESRSKHTALCRDVGDEALAAEELPRLVEREVGRRDHQLGRGELGIVQPLAAVADERRHLLELAVELVLV